MRGIIKILICLIFVMNQAFSQKVSEEIHKIKLAYQKNTQLTMDVSYKVYASHYSATPVETTTGSYKKRGKDFESNLNGLITLQNNKLLLTVDPEGGNILIASPKKNVGIMEGVPLDTMLSLYTKAKVSTLDGKNRRLSLVFNRVSDEEEYNPEIEKVDFYYNTSTFIIYKLVLYYGEPMSEDEEKLPKEKPRLEIAFSNINVKPVFTAGNFSEKVYLTKKGDKLIGANDYKTYEILDQRLKK